MGRAFVELFKHYNWTRVVMISKRKNDNRNVFCDYSSRSIEEAFHLNSIEIADYISIDAGITDKQIDTVLDRVKQRGRSKRGFFLRYDVHCLSVKIAFVYCLAIYNVLELARLPSRTFAKLRKEYKREKNDATHKYA